MSRALWIGGLLIGASAVFAGVALAAARQNSMPKSKAITLSPGSSSLSGVQPGSEIAIGLPVGARLATLAVDGTPYMIQVGNTSKSITVMQASGTIVVEWVDDKGVLQNSTISYGA